MKEVRVALIGYGGIAKSHKKGYDVLAAQNAPVKLVAVCDVRPEMFTSISSINIGTADNKGLGDIHTYTDVETLLKEEEFDMADICLPTYLHKEYAIRMLRAGKHVQSEKPMALSSQDCAEMIAVAKEEGKRLMIGQCLRFSHHYNYLKRCIESGCFGKLRHLYMDRLSQSPKWGFENWFADDKKSGGAILDLHIHDIDMARYLLGEPEQASTVALDGFTRWSVCNTRLFYPETTVFANGSWNESKSFGFKAGYNANFEKANVVFDKGVITVYPAEGAAYEPELPEVAEKRTNYMAEEIGYIASLILDENAENSKNPPESAMKTVELVETLRKSAAEQGKLIAFN